MTHSRAFKSLHSLHKSITELIIAAIIYKQTTQVGEAVLLQKECKQRSQCLQHCCKLLCSLATDREIQLEIFFLLIMSHKLKTFPVPWRQRKMIP